MSGFSAGLNMASVMATTQSRSTRNQPPYQKPCSATTSNNQNLFHARAVAPQRSMSVYRQVCEVCPKWRTAGGVERDEHAVQRQRAGSRGGNIAGAWRSRHAGTGELKQQLVELDRRLDVGSIISDSLFSVTLVDGIIPNLCLIVHSNSTGQHHREGAATSPLRQ